MRVWLPFVVAAICLAVAALWASTVLIWILGLVAIVCIMDGATLLFSRGGGMSDHRQ